MNAVGCHEIEEVSLSGRNVESLTDLLLNSTSQGSFSCFRLHQIDSNPLTITGKRKRQFGNFHSVVLSECIFIRCKHGLLKYLL